MPKPIHEMTDDELEAMSPEDTEAAMAALADGESAAAATAEGATDTDTGGEGEDTSASAPAANGEGTDEQLTAEQLEALANEGVGQVPIARLNEVLARLERAEARLNEQQAAQPAPQAEPEPELAEPEPYDFKAASRKMMKAIAEGDEEVAAEIADEIEDKREEQRQYDIALAEQRAADRIRGEQTKQSLTVVLKDVYARMPFLDNANSKADKSAITAINAEARRLIGEGVDPAEAIKAAANDLGPLFAQRLGIKLDSDAVKPEEKSVRKPAPGTDPRTRDSIARNVGIRQPDTLKTGVGNREAGSTLSIKDLTDEQLDALEKSGELDQLKTGSVDG